MLRFGARVQVHLGRTTQSRIALFRNFATKSFPPHTIVNMPALSPTMTQGNLGTWHAKIGTKLAPGDVMVEIETDKAQMDLECQEDGFLAQILLPEGSKDVLVSRPIAVMVEEESDVAAFASFGLVDIKEEGSAAEEEVEQVKEVKEVNVEKVETVKDVKETRVFASPAAKELASQMNIPLNAISGTGPDGLVIKRNVEAHKVAAPAPVAPAASVAPVQKKTPAAPLKPETVSSNYADTTVSGIRKVIASRLLESKTTIPHYYLTMEINVEKVVKQALNAESEGQFKLSVNDFIIKASALALQRVPAVNSSWHESYIRQYTNSDICVAVATPTGLITPILPASQTLGLAQISTSLKSLASRAKLGKLSPHEYTGGSFTISNLGMYGVKNFTAIINPPHAAILAVGAVRSVLVMKDGEVKAVSVMDVTLSLDHRVVDGAVGAEWLGVFRGLLENPLNMML